MTEVVDEPVEALADDELEIELTIAAHDPVRRSSRFELLMNELLRRRRGQAGFRPIVTPRSAAS